MPELRRILVPIDLTKRAQPAFDWALFLAEQHGATIEVLHVWEPPRSVLARDVNVTIDGLSRESLRDHLESQAALALDRFIEEHGNAAVEVTGRLECGLPAKAILEVAGEGEYDLLVIGTAGRKGLARFIVGSVAENVVRNAPCPVLTIRIKP